MAWLRVRDLVLTAGDRVLVSGVTFRLDPGDRIGLVGPNGMGKTSLFRVLRGQALPQAGRIDYSEDLTWASLDQLATRDTGTVWDVAYGANPHIAEWGRRLAELERRMADVTGPELDHLLDEYADLQERYLTAGGYEWDARVRQVLEGLGFSGPRLNDPADRLSGGERHRLALARVVLSGASIWLLDEPTNHLDVEALEWLERTLLQFSGAVLMASHDRRFLDRTATRIISWEDGSFFTAVGGYRQYATLRRQRLERLQDAWRRYQEERARLMSFVDRYRAGSRARQAKSRLHAVARLDRAVQAPPIRPRSAPRITTHGGQTLTGTSAVAVDRLILQAGDRTWQPLSFKVPTAARLGVAGPNGCGKTTLLSALARSAPGVHWNPDTTLVWYDQHAADTLPTAATGLELAHEEGMDRETAHSLAARFGLHAELMRTPVGYWSGGERARLALLFALMAPANVLLLDEPTNHLDLPMREELEGLLTRYPGVIVLVTHDRELLDRVSTHSLLWVDQAFHFVPRPYSEAMASLGRAGA
jgi:ATP-binding cassette subfamily F protein 3